MRARQWQRVLTGLVDGTLRVGSRTPVAQTPPWITLDVVHGGFATGGLAAAGLLQPHESRKLDSLPRPGQATDRATLNLHFLSDLGRPELESMLASGCFRIHLPEEGALLIGAFSGKFLRAAQVAGRMLEGSLYERYYGIPYDSILALDDVEQHRFGAPTSPGFARLGEERAGADPWGGRPVARNGTIVEQAEILTTHNLAVLFDALDLGDALRARLPVLVRQCLEWICKQQLQIRDQRA